MSSVGDLNTRVRRPSVAGSNTQLLLNIGGVEGASPNLIYNVGANTLSTEGNIRIANTNGLYFGGQHSNTVANSHYSVSYNAAATSLDFSWLG